MAARFEYRQAREIAVAFKKHGVRYLFIGKSGLVCHIDDIIRSKEATGRVKDMETLPRLRAFRSWWVKQRGDA